MLSGYFLQEGEIEKVFYIFSFKRQKKKKLNRNQVKVEESKRTDEGRKGWRVCQCESKLAAKVVSS